MVLPALFIVTDSLVAESLLCQLAFVRCGNAIGFRLLGQVDRPGRTPQAPSPALSPRLGELLDARAAAPTLSSGVAGCPGAASARGRQSAGWRRSRPRSIRPTGD